MVKNYYDIIFNNLMKLAKKAYDENEIPISAIIFCPKKNKIISKAHNVCKSNSDPLGHAEIIAIRKASNKVKNYRFDDMYIFTTLEPCLMCTSIILNAKFKRLYFFIEDKKSGALINNQKLIYDKKILKKPKIYYGFKETEYSKLLKRFFLNRR
tara:strand:+ start:392 stop:853 length:462 start_codon:yes stop_codon:yes gene_type:complete